MMTVTKNVSPEEDCADSAGGKEIPKAYLMAVWRA